MNKNEKFPVSPFSPENIKSISIYKIEDDKRNPINEYDYGPCYGGCIYGDNCNTPRPKLIPEKTIPLG